MLSVKRIFKQSLRSAAYGVAPRAVVNRYLHYKMLRQARELCRLRDSGARASALIEALSCSHFFRPLQKKTEILRLVETIGALRPATLCEIGAAGGGTTFLLAQAAAKDATIVTLDLAFTESRRAAVSLFASERQKIVCLQNDSHSAETVQLVSRSLEGQSLDVLYVDGDHSYEGIKTDFELYSPLVKRGGLIVFHDIVPDYKTRYGIETASYVGGVPQFWDEMKTSGLKMEEIVEDYGQDGYGIGILHWDGATLQSGVTEKSNV